MKDHCIQKTCVCNICDYLLFQKAERLLNEFPDKYHKYHISWIIHMIALNYISEEELKQCV